MAEKLPLDEVIRLIESQDIRGLSKGISMIENGKREPSVKLLKAIAETLEVDLDDLVV